MRKFSEKNWLLFCILAASCLAVIWVKQGFVLGTAEEGLKFFNLARTLEVYSSVWYERGLGIAVPFMPATWPLLSILSLISNLVGIYFIQLLFFFVVLFAPLVFIPKLIKSVGGQANDLVSYGASVLYLINFYTQTQVFHRFIFHQMLVWAFLPVFLYLWQMYLAKQRKSYLAIFLVLSVLFSYIFSQPSNIFVIWIPAGILSLKEILITRDLRYLTKSVVGILCWLIISIWWIYPIWTLRNDDYSPLQNPESSISSLTEISKYFTNEDIFFLKQKFYFDRPGYFNTLAATPKAQIASVVLLMFLFVGSVALLVKRRIRYFVVLLAVGWFICKGVNPPLGSEFYRTLFKKIPFAAVFRNPYEKFGMVFSLSYTILAAHGMRTCLNLIRSKALKDLLFVLGIIAFVLIIGTPILNGNVFLGHYYIKVPHAYEEANNIIKKIGDGRVLHLPFRSVSNIKYTWAFEGEDPSVYLFDNPSISGINTSESEYEYLSRLPKVFGSSYFPNILRTLNVDFLIIHNDLISDSSYSSSVDNTRRLVKNWKNLTRVTTIGDLEIYQTVFPSSPITVANKLEYFSSIDDAFMFMASDMFNPFSQAVVVGDQGAANKPEVVKQEVVPDVKHTKISSGRYQVEIKGAVAPYVLILNQAYNSNWVATYDNMVFEKRFEVNGYANGWIIDKEGDYTVNIKLRVWPWD